MSSHIHVAPPPVPWVLVAGDPAAGSGGALATNTSYLAGVTVEAPMTITALSCVATGTPTGHVDLGIYDANGNLLGHTGVQALAAGVNRFTLSAAMSLAPGRYYLALWIDNGTDAILKASRNLNGSSQGFFPAWIGVSTNSGGLLATTADMGGLTAAASKPYVLGIIAGGWS